MITWKCPDCGAQARTANDRERGPFCSKTHHPIRMERTGEDGVKVETPPVADGDEIVWRDPPPISSRGRKADEERGRFVAVLRTRPGAWALYPKPYKSTPSCTQLAKRYPGTEWVARVITKGKVEVYGRWVGDVEQPAA